MEGPWSKYQAVEPAAAAGPWSKYQPTAAPAPAQQPVVDQSAPDLNMAGDNKSGPDARATQADVLWQGAAHSAAALAGAPIDLATLATNIGSAGVNIGAHALHLNDGKDVTGYLGPQPGGSQGLSDIAGAIYHAGTGNNALRPEDLSPEDRILYNSISDAGAGLLTDAMGPVLSKAASFAKRPFTAPPTTVPLRGVESAVPRMPTPTSMASGAAAGAGAGEVQGNYDEYGHPIISKIPYAGPALDATANVLATLGGAIGGHQLSRGAGAVARLATVPPRALASKFMPGKEDEVFPLQNGAVASPKDQDVAANIAQSMATDPKQAAEQIGRTTNELRAAGTRLPTSGGMSEDAGLVGLEQKLRLQEADKPDFIQNDRRVNQAAVDAVNKIAPEAAVGRTFTDTADQMQKDRVAAAQGNVETTSQEINRLEDQRRAEAAPIELARNTQVPASQALDKNVVDQTLLPMQQKNAEMYGKVDPDKAAVVSSDPMIEAAQKVRDTLGTFNNPDKVIPAGLLRRIEGTKPANELDPAVEAELARHPQHIQEQVRAALGAAEEPATTSVGDIVDVYPELRKTEQQANRAGNVALAQNIRALRTSMDGVIEKAAAGGDEAAQRAMEAKQNYKDTIGTTFGDGPGGPATKLRKDVTADRFDRSYSPPEDTAGRFLQPGQPEKAASLKNILANSPDPGSGQRAAGQYLAADLASHGAIVDGKLNPQAIANWRSKFGEDTLAVAPGFKKQLDDLQTSAASGRDQASRLGQQLRAHNAALEEIKQNDTAFKNVVGHSPVKAVDAIFKSNDPERAMQEIVGKLGEGTAAHDGLKAAVRENLIQRDTTTALHKTSEGDNPISFAKLDTLFKTNEGTLSRVFSHEEMHSLQTAHTFLKSLNNLQQQSLAGSATAERSGATERLLKVIEIGLKTRYGGLEGGNKMRNLKLAASLQGGGANNVPRLLVEMQFNPELAQKLLTRDVKKLKPQRYDPKFFDPLVLGGAVARNNIDNQQPTK